ncbi:MAG: SusC/RagA family TonB-linked outer membrane protein [Bacteroidota bacterium]
MRFKPSPGKIARAVSLLCIIFSSFTAIAQTKVSGKVINKKTNQPLADVSIVEKGSSAGTASSPAGTFSLNVKTTKSILVVSYIGYITQEIPVNGKAIIEVLLDEDVKGIEDVVIIGYQNSTRRKTSAAISSVKGKDIENTPYATFDQMLQGRVAGLNVLSVSAEPGASGIVNIRGNSSVSNSSGSGTATGISAPLYVIDGVVFDVSDLRSAYGNSNPLAVINPNDIESIDVLKDASAAAIYGARAANGVIIVKTKRPKGGKPQFRFSTYMGLVTKPTQKPVIVGAEERRLKMDLLREQATYTQNKALSQFLTDSLNPAFNNATDFQSLFFRDAMIRNYDFNVAGSSETMSYRLSLNRYEENGIQPGYGITRTAPRLFVSAKPTSNLEFTSDIYLGFVKEQRGDGTGNVVPYSIQSFPSSFWQIDDATRANYLGKNDKVRDDNRTTSLNGNLRMIWKPIKDVTFTSSLSYNYGFLRRDYLRDRSVVSNNRSDAFLTESNSRRWELENYATWNKDFGARKEHSVSLLVGQGAEEQVINSTSANANGIPFDAIRVISGVPSGPNLGVSTNFEERARVSYFTRASYEYKGRYGIDASFRRDASSRYAASSRWGTFPAISGRWNISEEPFFAPLRNVVSFMKFRVSYGVTGRDPGSYYAQYRQLTTDVRYPTSSLGAGATGNVITYNGVTAVTPNYAAAAPATNITWEKAPQTNIGMDINFLKDRFSLSVDLYNKASKDLIFNIPVQITSGYTSATNNFVDLVNRGVEISLNTNNLSNKSKLKWQTSLNLAFNDNYVTKLPDGNRDFTYGPVFLSRILTIGQPIYGFRVFNLNGVYPTTGNVPVDPLTGLRTRIYGGAQFVGGDNAKQDINGDYNVDDNDMIIKGNPNTKVYGGLVNTFTYKGFSLQILTTFIAGRSVWNGYLSDKLTSASNNPPVNFGLLSGPAAEFNNLNLWRRPGDNATLGSLFSTNDPWTIRSSVFVEDASFFRIKTINFGYTLPASDFMKKLGVRQIRFYGVADNLKVFYKANLPDPESIGVDGFTTANGYPTPKKFTVGVDIQF